MRPSHLTAILKREFLSTSDNRPTPVMVWGPPGIGKSQIVAQVAAQHEVPVIDIRLSQMEPTDLRGIPFRDGDSWEVADRALKKFGDAPDLLLDGLQACVGAAAGIEFKAFMDHIRDLPDIEAIANGTSHAMPGAIDLVIASAATQSRFL